MAEKLEKGWNISSPLNAAFLALLLILAAGAIAVSLLNLFGFPLFFTGTVADLEAMPGHPEFSIGSGLPEGPMRLSNSPHSINITLLTPPLESGHEIEIIVVSNRRVVERLDCPDEGEIQEGATNITCLVNLKYDYLREADVTVYATLDNGESEYAASQQLAGVDWSGYERNFWASSAIMLGITVAGLLVVGAVALAMFYFSTRIRHGVEYDGEYSLSSLINPLKRAKSASHAFQAIISSPLFWAVELVGILIVLAYLAMMTAPWKSSTALFAFFISGAIALITPFLWAALMWFADFREREPLRLLVTMFLWGGLACLMAVGLNSIGGELLAVCGLGFLAASFTAPITEELFKGMGLVLLSFHHEFDDMVDGIVFGFTIGMGFSFVEDWLYLLKNPMGADVWSWLAVFTLRSIFFAANHGVFTALTGAAIGLLKQWQFPYAPIGMLGGMIPAMLLHAIHNSGEIWQTLLGTPGMCAYCCVLLPIFDYGGLAAVALLMIGGVALAQAKKQ